MNIDQKICQLEICHEKQQNLKLAKAAARYMEMDEFKDSAKLLPRITCVRCSRNTAMYGK